MVRSYDCRILLFNTFCISGGLLFGGLTVETLIFFLDFFLDSKRGEKVYHYGNMRFYFFFPPVNDLNCLF